MKTVLFVCTGNTCRSPMAMAIFNEMVRQKGINGYRADSAGLAATGAPIHPYSVKALAKIGIFLSDYQSKRLTPRLLQGAFLIVTMTAAQAEMLTKAGIPAGRVVVLGDGIPDPFGGSEEDYIECRNQIQAGVDRLLSERLCV